MSLKLDQACINRLSVKQKETPNDNYDFYVNGTAAISSTFNLNSLTASTAVVTDSNKNLISRAILNNTNTGALGWNSSGNTHVDNQRFLTVNTLAYWNGAYSGTNSNLKYYEGGQFGTMAKETAADYAKLASPALTGTPTAPTAANGTNTTQIATTAFVNNTLAYVNAMKFKGTLGTGGTITALPASHDAGDTYRVITAGTWAGKYCEVGTLIICTTDGTAANDAHWTSVETNEDGAVIGPASATDNGIVLFSGNTGRIIKDSSKTITTTAPASSAADTTIPTSKAVWSTIAGLDFTEIGGGTGDYISKISQTDGKISATKSTTTSTFTITGGTAAGPTIKISINGVNSTNAPAIPSASETASGIVTTDTQAFAGAKTFNTSVTVKGDIIFPQANKLDWNDGTYRQRLVITDDSTANTEVFTFQQSANSGTNYSNLFTILDNKSVATDRYCYTISDAIKAYTQYNSTDDSIDFIFA